MSENDSPPALRVPAREIPVPTSISPQAQAVLAQGVIGGTPQPPPDDLDAWRVMIAQTSELVRGMLTQGPPPNADVEDTEIAGVRTFTITPHSTGAADRRIYLDIHGGALVGGGDELCRVTGIAAANRFGIRVWAPDYRMPPDHPYPTPLDDCLAVYRQVLASYGPENVVVGGGSAGGNLAAALILRARDEGLPLPAAAVLISPEVDLTESGDTFHTMLGVDTVGGGQSLMNANLLYAGGHDLTHPYLSPLFGDFAKGFPPTLLTSGTRDFFLSNTVRMHRALRAAGVDAQLHVLEACPHGGFMVDTPEQSELDADIRQFIDQRLSG
ncbi:alpha/beta hydrolase [Pseudofrankia inefficax]|uniref:Esterase/lipase/thioesterase n=1 Tax=Pseudofrankia inefficax (strain DSM 45817 / CECT 9037 / DDB 130130 / EuI1c) TaxID=298654 RepID=E3J9A7_PSEI1|nr:alpha/beta hydrolase [Pseudofrankia inefficax]ADP82126.1 esterase/lipase/thioesterase [Pseudofrankia inefficax]